MAKISVIGGVSDKNAPAPEPVAVELAEPIQVEDVIAGAVKPAAKSSRTVPAQRKGKAS